MLDFLKEANWWCLLLLLLLAFLLGWFLSRWVLKNKYESELEECEQKNAKLQRENNERANSTFSAPPAPAPVPDPPKVEIDTEIKAPEVDISANLGASTDDSEKEKPTLNFDSFGMASASEKDDLKLISGIGPFIEEKLNGIGIYTFNQISRFTKEDIETVTELIKFFPGRIERDNWTDQARKLKE